jgi:hypothetical protein
MDKWTYAFTNVTEAGDNSNLTSEHDISRTLNAIDEGFAAAVIVIELGLGDRVIDIYGWNLQPSLAVRLV